MAEENKVLRRKLKVISIGQSKSIGRATLYPFKATDIEKGQEFDYEFWSKTFADYIKPDIEIDVDIEYSQKGEYKHRKVIQLYKDGQPVLKISKGGGFRSQRDEDRTDARTAIMSITELIKADKLKDNDPLKLAFQTWCYTALGVKITKKPS